ncbi:glycosyltransferase family 4 protein [Pleurocapsales cyanobacterium LEGE 10410]|nr:glycosyltransferase family 4 protein [Pleurocapsales cyanobacterium LEGE 10410]
MKVMYDISVLGLGFYHSRARTGVFRVVENLVYELANLEACELKLCSGYSWKILNQSINYLQANPELQAIPFLSPGLHKNIYTTLKTFVKETNEKENVNIGLKCLEKLSCYLTKYIESDSSLLDLHKISHINIYHSPFYPIPTYLAKNKNIQKFLTVYDLIPMLFPHFFKFNEDHVVNKAVKGIELDGWAVCISNSTKNDLCNYLKYLDPNRVFVTHLAASDLFYRCTDFQAIANAKSKYRIPSDTPYLLSLSTLEPRKNIEFTIRCFAKLVEQEKIKDLNLVLVGAKGWDYDKIFEEMTNLPSLQDRIIVTGYVDDRDLAALYSDALAFVYPSFYEGFGLPPLEAMQCGVPVITSNTSSLPEVVGDAGILISPTDADSLCHSILNIYNKPSLRDSMSLKSIEQAKQFSWEKCTQKTIQAYKTALDR